METIRKRYRITLEVDVEMRPLPASSPRPLPEQEWRYQQTLQEALARDPGALTIWMREEALAYIDGLTQPRLYEALGLKYAEGDDDPLLTVLDQLPPEVCAWYRAMANPGLPGEAIEELSDSTCTTSLRASIESLP